MLCRPLPWGTEVTCRSEKKRQGTPEPEIQTGSRRLPLYGGSDPGCGPAVKNKRQQPAYVSDQLKIVEDNKKEKREKERKEVSGETKGHGPGRTLVVIQYNLLIHHRWEAKQGGRLYAARVQLYNFILITTSAQFILRHLRQ
jgi:hypothetical protein